LNHTRNDLPKPSQTAGQRGDFTTQEGNLPIEELPT